MFHIVLIEPEIPPNTGNIGRLCLATGSRLHLVGRLGFSLDDRSLKRAGLDYWADVDLMRWESFADLRRKAAADAHFFYFTTKTERGYWSAEFRDGDHLVFGCETRGLPQSLLAENEPACLTIPQRAGRSLNLGTATGIALYEAIRQGNSGTGI